MERRVQLTVPSRVNIASQLDEGHRTKLRKPSEEEDRKH